MRLTHPDTSDYHMYSCRSRPNLPLHGILHTTIRHTERFKTPFISAFSPEVPDASCARVGVFNQISTPDTSRLASLIS